MIFRLDLRRVLVARSSLELELEMSDVFSLTEKNTCLLLATHRLLGNSGFYVFCTDPECSLRGHFLFATFCRLSSWLDCIPSLSLPEVVTFDILEKIRVFVFPARSDSSSCGGGPWKYYGIFFGRVGSVSCGTRYFTKCLPPVLDVQYHSGLWVSSWVSIFEDLRSMALRGIGNDESKFVFLKVFNSTSQLFWSSGEIFEQVWHGDHSGNGLGF